MGREGIQKIACEKEKEKVGKYRYVPVAVKER